MLTRVCCLMAVVVMSNTSGCGTSNRVPITQINVTPCNSWVWVRTSSGRPIVNAQVTTGEAMSITDGAGYACFMIHEPTAVRIHGGTLFQGSEFLLVPGDTKEIRLPWMQRAN